MQKKSITTNDTGDTYNMCDNSITNDISDTYIISDAVPTNDTGDAYHHYHRAALSLL